MQGDRLEASQRVVQEVVRKWARGKPWAAELAADLLQEAMLAVLAAEANHREELGPWEAYAAGAAHFAVQRYAWRYRAPVAPPRRERGGARVQYLGGDEALAAMLALPSGALTPEVQAAKLEARELARRALRALDKSSGKVGLATVLGERPSDVARRRRVPVRDVYAARKNLVRRAENSPELQALAEALR